MNQAFSVDFRSALAQVRADRAVHGILFSNLVTLVIAVVQGWGLLHLLWPFWAQSVIIGWYARKRILRLENFCTKGLKINGRHVDATPQAARQTANFFLIHYGIFHFVYLAFLVGMTINTDPSGYLPVTMEDTGEVLNVSLGVVERLDLAIYAVLTLGFILSHQRSFNDHVERDLAGKPNLGTLMFLPYARILPMHLCILIGLPFGGGGVVWFFMILKTGADVLMHIVEHHVLARSAGADD